MITSAGNEPKWGDTTSDVAIADLDRAGLPARSPEHDPEKWSPVFGKDHAPINICAAGQDRLHRAKPDRPADWAAR
jgi:hypothetical protein